MNEELDYRRAQSAARRVVGPASYAGVQFKMARRLSSKGITNHQRNARLSWEKVREIRAYASREGWGRPVLTLSQLLGPQYGVSPMTMSEVISNRSWYDRDYAPGVPDLAYWGRVTPTVILLRLIA